MQVYGRLSNPPPLFPSFSAPFPFGSRCFGLLVRSLDRWECDFLFAWWRAILQGVLQILWCNVVVNRGEFVVGCVVKRGELTTTFPESKMCHYFDLFFVYFSLLIFASSSHETLAQFRDTSAHSPSRPRACLRPWPSRSPGRNRRRERRLRPPETPLPSPAKPHPLESHRSGE